MTTERHEHPGVPPDPAGTQPKVDPSSLLPARIARPPSFEPPAPAPDTHPGDDVDPVAADRPRREAPHAARFQFLLGALLAVGAMAVAGLVYAVGGGGGSSGSSVAWSPWKPKATGLEGAQEIADHVGPLYRLTSGEQLVLVTGGRLEVADLPVTVAMRDAAGDISLVEGDGVLYRLCGLGPKCAIAEGKPSSARHLLLRREALELALYSFRYLRDIDQVVVFMPPRMGAEPDQALFFRRRDVQRWIDAPLRATLQTPAPTTKTVVKARDSGLVNRVTTRGLFTFSLTQGNQDANVFLVLEPFDSGRAAGEPEAGPGGSHASGAAAGSGPS